MVCPAFSALQTPLEVVGESEQSRSVGFFGFVFISLLSLLASSVKSWLLQTLKASSTKVDNGVWGLALRFRSFLWMSGVAWLIKMHSQ